MTRRNRNRILLIVPVLLLGVLIWQLTLPTYKRFWYHRFQYTNTAYRKVCASIDTQRTTYRNAFANAADTNQVKKIYARAGADFVNRFEQLTPYWLGTPYNFYGTTRTPGFGGIACGYFVTTLLDQMGVTLNRDSLAEIASEKMIRDMVSVNAVRRCSKYTLENFLAEVAKYGEGLYLVGLDTHTGFLLYRKGEFRFIHASGRKPWCVTSQKPEEAKSIATSIYRVFARLDSDMTFIDRWIFKQ